MGRGPAVIVLVNGLLGAEKQFRRSQGYKQIVGYAGVATFNGDPGVPCRQRVPKETENAYWYRRKWLPAFQRLALAWGLEYRPGEGFRKLRR